MSALATRFWKRVDKRGDGECWEWRGYHFRGYGQLKVDGRVLNTHRIAWTLVNGEVPEGMHVCHTCRNSWCVNPEHLYLAVNYDRAHLRDRPPVFWSKIQQGVPEECWEWQASRLARGYGHLKWGGRYRPAHAVAWELVNDVCVLPGFCVLHRCDNPPCCNPAHLFLGTKGDNAADRDTKGRTTRGEQTSQAKLKEADIPVIRRLAREGWTDREIGNAYGVCPAAISLALKGKNWAHIPEGVFSPGEVRRPPKTHCSHNHPYDAENTRLRRDGSRACKTCERTRALRHYHTVALRRKLAQQERCAVPVVVADEEARKAARAAIFEM